MVAVAAYVTQPVFCRAPFLEVRDAIPGLERVDLLVAGGAYRGEIDARLAALARTVLILRGWPRPQPTTVTGAL